MMSPACRVCGCRKDHDLYEVLDNAPESSERCTYFQCSRCRCVQIVTVPSSPRMHHAIPTPKDFGIIESPFKAFRKRLRTTYHLHGRNPIGRILAGRKIPRRYTWLRGTGVGLNSRVLDVCCGSGGLLRLMCRDGFRHLTGIEPSLDSSVEFGPNLNLLKQGLMETEGTYDLIMLHHCFSRMPKQKEVLSKLHQLCAPNGCIMIRMPVVDTYAWRSYKTDWVHFDPPQQLCLHSLRSFELLMHKADLMWTGVEFDSDEFLFYGSEQRQYGIAIDDPRSWYVNPDNSIFNETIMCDYRERAKELNAANDGDQACFYLRHA